MALAAGLVALVADIHQALLGLDALHVHDFLVHAARALHVGCHERAANQRLRLDGRLARAGLGVHVHVRLPIMASEVEYERLAGLAARHANLKDFALFVVVEHVVAMLDGSRQIAHAAGAAAARRAERLDLVALGLEHREDALVGGHGEGLAGFFQQDGPALCAK